ncbi:MAG TPA: hypothetical protein VKJ65_14730 [Phycisphaerae bacterium]|nr:hypothetical protein [Phycisphaerae bacterium]
MTEAGTCGGTAGWVTGAVVYMPRGLGEVVAVVLDGAAALVDEALGALEQPLRIMGMAGAKVRQNNVAAICLSRI